MPDGLECIQRARETPVAGLADRQFLSLTTNFRRNQDLERKNRRFCFRPTEQTLLTANAQAVLHPPRMSS
jgi:hypothetical protein